MKKMDQDAWHEAAWAAANLARHTAIACGASRSIPSPYHEESAEDELRRVARAMGFSLTRVCASVPAQTEEAA